MIVNKLRGSLDSVAVIVSSPAVEHKLLSAIGEGIVCSWFQNATQGTADAVLSSEGSTTILMTDHMEGSELV
jgi:hypothetical protein